MTKYVIFKQFGKFKMTTEANYNAQVMNANKITHFYDFDTAEEVINWCKQYIREDRLIDKTND
jgi:hypothetical protein